jgi:colanic acid biosynthesis glycosyl transferase WcaI
MKKRLLLIGYNFSPEPTGIGKYSGEMISWLVAQGYDCTVITSYPYYPYWKVQEPYHKKRFWFSVEESHDVESGGRLRVFRCPQFVPSRPSGLKRILLDFSFSFSACFPVVKLLFERRFNYVMAVAPSFQIGIFGILFKKLRNSKFLYHIQDLQIEAAQDLKMIRSRSVIDMLFRIEKFILKNSDVISTISPSMVAKVKEKVQMKDVVLFPNWTDVKSFFPILDKGTIKTKYGYKETDKVILYSGAIGEKQGLDSIIKIADELRDVKDLKFVICGSGPYKKDLQELAFNLNLENLAFMPLQSFSEFNSFLNLADVHLVIQKAGAIDLVMPSKLTTILAVGGLAVITANEGTGLYSLVKKHNIGVLADTENSADLKECIVRVTSNDFKHISVNARRYAVEFLSTDKILGSYEEAIQSGNVAYGMSPQYMSPGARKVAALGPNLPGVPETKPR